MAHEHIRLNYSLHTLTLMLNLLCNRALLTDNVSSRRSPACREFFSLSREGISSKLGGQCFISLAIAYPFIFLLSLLKKKSVFILKLCSHSCAHALWVCMCWTPSPESGHFSVHSEFHFFLLCSIITKTKFCARSSFIHISENFLIR